MIGFIKGGSIGAKLNYMDYKDINQDKVESAMNTVDLLNSNEF